MAPNPATADSVAALQAAYEGLVKIVARSGSRQMRTACPRLLRDMLAVLTGLRPAFMLDYGQLCPEAVAVAAASVAAALGLQVAAAQCCVAVLNDCSYLVRPAALPDPAGCCPRTAGAPRALSGAGAAAGGQQHLQRQACGLQPPGAEQRQQPQPQLQQAPAQPPLTPPPLMFIAFDGSTARWASLNEAAEAAAALAALQAGLLAAVGVPQLYEEAAGNRAGGSGGGGPSLPVVEAAGIPGWDHVVPPTVSGYLLGYPALYLCHSLEAAQQASRTLSSCSLCVHTVACQVAALPPGVPAAEDQPLLGFSVPAELVAAREWGPCRDAWRAAVQARAAAAAAENGFIRWQAPCLSIVQHPPRPVAL